MSKDVNKRLKSYLALNGFCPLWNRQQECFLIFINVDIVCFFLSARPVILPPSALKCVIFLLLPSTLSFYLSIPSCTPSLTFESWCLLAVFQSSDPCLFLVHTFHYSFIPQPTILFPFLTFNTGVVFYSHLLQPCDSHHVLNLTLPNLTLA